LKFLSGLCENLPVLSVEYLLRFFHAEAGTEDAEFAENRPLPVFWKWSV